MGVNQLPERQPVPVQPQGSAAWLYVFLTMVVAVVTVFIVFPGAALGVFYPPCTYYYPARATPTPSGTPRPTRTPTVTPAPTATPLPPPPGTIAPTALPAELVTATAEAREQFVSGRAALQEDTAQYAVYAHCLGDFNQFIDYTVKFLAIAAAVVTTISATQGWRVVGFTSGALVTALTAFQTTFPMEARASFYQSIAFEVDSVMSTANFGVTNEQDLRALRTRFEQIKASAAAGPIVRSLATQTPIASVTVTVTIVATPSATVGTAPAPTGGTPASPQPAPPAQPAQPAPAPTATPTG